MTRKEKRFFDKELKKLAYEVIGLCKECEKEGVKTEILYADIWAKDEAKISLGNFSMTIYFPKIYLPTIPRVMSWVYYKDIRFSDYENMTNVLRIAWNIFNEEKERLSPLLDTHKNNIMKEFEAEFSTYLTRN